MKQIIIAIVAIVAIIGGATLLGNNKEEVTAAPSNHFYGKEDASVVLVEYADLECPACAAYFPIVSQIKEQFKDQIRFDFRHFPLVQIHGNAQAAHRALEAAGQQGKFWEMHDIMFQQQRAWNSQATTTPSGIFETYAQQLSLDMDKFKADVTSSETLATINADVARGKEADVSGTPTFFLNDKKIEDTTTIDTVEEFAALINEALGNTPTEQESTPQATTENEPDTAPQEAQQTSGE